MHGSLNATWAGNIQRAEWPARNNRSTSSGLESHYFDFYVEVPSVSGDAVYLGYVSYDDYELRVFNDKYEIWQRGGGSALGAYTAATAGRRNIGIRAGQGASVWVDGVEIFSGGPSLVTDTVAGFGSKAVHQGGDTYTPGLTLFENLNYQRAWYRTQFEETDGLPLTGPRVFTRTFDNDFELKRNEIGPDEQDSICTIYEGDGAYILAYDVGGLSTFVALGNGRNAVAHVVGASADSVVADGETGELCAYLDEALPGIAQTTLFDGVGVPRNHIAAALHSSRVPSSYSAEAQNPGVSDMPAAPVCLLGGIPMNFAPYGDASTGSGLAGVGLDAGTGMISTVHDGSSWDNTVDVCGGWKAGQVLREYLENEVRGHTPLVRARDNPVEQRLQEWERILRNNRSHGDLYDLLRYVMASKGISIRSHVPTGTPPDRKTFARPMSDEQKKQYEEYADRRDAEKRQEFWDHIWRNARDLLNRGQPVQIVRDIYGEVRSRVGCIGEGDYVGAALGEERRKRIEELAESEDRYGNKVGILGGALAEVGEAVGVRAMGDGGEKLSDGVREGDARKIVEGAREFVEGVGQFGAASAAVAGGGMAGGAAKGVGKRGKAPEFPGGKVTESKFLDHVEDYLGEGYTSAGNGRYVSKDGMRQVRYGDHETKSGGVHHGHFEAYDKPGGKVVETSTVEIVKG